MKSNTVQPNNDGVPCTHIVGIPKQLNGSTSLHSLVVATAVTKLQNKTVTSVKAMKVCTADRTSKSLARSHAWLLHVPCEDGTNKPHTRCAGGMSTDNVHQQCKAWSSRHKYTVPAAGSRSITSKNTFLVLRREPHMNHHGTSSK